MISNCYPFLLGDHIRQRAYPQILLLWWNGLYTGQILPEGTFILHRGKLQEVIETNITDLLASQCVRI